MIEAIKSLRWLDYYLFTLTEPRKLAIRITRGEPNPFPLSLTVIAMVAIISIITSSILETQTPFFYSKITYGWILLFLIIFLKITILSSLIDLTCQFLGHEGNVTAIISLIGFSLFPQTFLLPVVYIFVVFQFAPLFFYILTIMALLIWSAIIIIQGISEINKISFSKSALIFIFPFLLIGGIAFLIIILIIINLITYISIV